MKLLYISKKVTKISNGGEICTKRNELVLKKVLNSDFYHYELVIGNKLSQNKNKLFFFYPGLKFSDFNIIANQIKNINPSFVFIDTAQYGILCRFIKKKFPKIKIVTFFHNIELMYAKSYFSIKNPKSWYFLLLTKINEKRAINYSDIKITINQRDSDVMYELYKKRENFVLPFSLTNQITKNKFDELKKKNKKIYSKNCLFVGSNFFGNTEGLTWFINEILPHTDIKLTIVGSGMSTVFTNTQNITVYDYVESLDDYYTSADFVLLPIISGGGMKTKTAEAMMWGKAIIGTTEAFTGYELNNIHGIYMCNTINEFIQTIKLIYEDNIFYFNECIYKVFEDKYSIENSIKIIQNIFEQEGKK